MEQTFLSAQSMPSSPFLDSRSDGVIGKTHRRLPHWTCDSVIYWVTFRLADSLPKDKLRHWREERDLWRRHNPEPWEERTWREYKTRFSARLEQWMDAGYGSCSLAVPHVRNAVRDCLLRFNGKRLTIHAAVIMPNHLHLLIEPLGNHTLTQLMKGLKGASARKANQILETKGTFWLDESFDHIVRNESQYHHLINYTVQNPIKAGLKEDEYWLYQWTISEEHAP